MYARIGFLEAGPQILPVELFDPRQEASGPGGAVLGVIDQSGGSCDRTRWIVGRVRIGVIAKVFVDQRRESRANDRAAGGHRLQQRVGGGRVENGEHQGGGALIQARQFGLRHSGMSSHQGMIYGESVTGPDEIGSNTGGGQLVDDPA